MKTSKPFINDPYEFSRKQEQAVSTRLEDLPENRKRWPTNNDLCAVIRHFKGVVWVRFPTMDGIYTLQLGKQALLKELGLTGHLRSDFAIYSVNPVEPSLILTALNPASFSPLR